MKIQCDVCERAQATVICCADEAALCGKCDVQVHAANKLAGKHRRLLLHPLSSNLPSCDICQDKAAFIFCVEDRALFCRDCDHPIHSAGSLSANHQRFLAAGIRVALTSNNSCDSNEPPSQTGLHSTASMKLPVPQQQQPSSFASTSPWGLEGDLLGFSDFESSTDKKERFELGEFEWLNDMGLFGELPREEALAAAQVPQLPLPFSANAVSYRPSNSSMPYKKPRIEISDDDDEFFTVPDLG